MWWNWLHFFSFFFFFHFILFSLCLSVSVLPTLSLCVFGSACARAHAVSRVWKSEDNFESQFSPFGQAKVSLLSSLLHTPG